MFLAFFLLIKSKNHLQKLFDQIPQVLSFSKLSLIIKTLQTLPQGLVFMFDFDFDPDPELDNFPTQGKDPPSPKSEKKYFT